MVTKQQIEDECNKEIERINSDIALLEKEHLLFEAEDREDVIRQQRYRLVQKTIERLNETAYRGNWGNSHNSYYGNIPSEFRFSEDYKDLQLIKDALREIEQENKKKIENTEEYKQLEKESELTAFSKFSERHNELHEKLTDLSRELRWITDKKNSIQTKAGLIKVSKERAERERKLEERRILEERAEFIRKKVRELIQ